MASQPLAVENEGAHDKITWFRRLSPEQKSGSRFSLPDWLRRSKGASLTAEEGDPTPTATNKDTSSFKPLQHTSSLPDLSVENKQDAKPVPPKKSESSLNTSFLAPLAELGQISSRLRIDMPWRQETQQQREPSPAKLTLPIQSGSQRTDESDISFGKQPVHSLATVLRHLSTVVDRSGNLPQDYRESDFKQYWMPDSQCKECYECGEKFTTFRRRHHCRVCGQIFCRRCCNQEVPGKFMGYTGNLRVCIYCCKIVLSYAQSSMGDLKMLQEDYFTLMASEMLSANTPDTPRKKLVDSALPRQSTNLTDSFDPFELVQTPKTSNLETSIQSVAKERQQLLKDSAQLHQLWLLIQHPNNGIMFQSHRFRLRTYNDCVVGSEVVDWLLLKDKATHRLQAVAIGQALLDAKWLECATSHDHIFRDEYALYRGGKTARLSVCYKDSEISLTEHGELDEDRMEPSWFREIDQEYKEDLTDDDGLATIMRNQSEVGFVKRHRRATSGGESIVTWSRSLRPATDMFTAPNTDKVSLEGIQRETAGPWEQEETAASIGEAFPNDALSTFGFDQPDQARGPILAHGWLDMDVVSQENGERETLEMLRAARSEKLLNLLEQQLKEEGLDMSWKETILSLTKRICSLVKPDVMNGDDMDIRQYVHIKKVPGGSRADCFMVNGTICTKNVAHKKMLGLLSNPRILLLNASIEHQRVENKFSSIDPIVLQEHEYLKNCVARIASLKPDILIVERTVARLAQTFLLHSGITLVLNVKPSVMDRLSRSIEVGLVHSIDQVNQTTPLGQCLNFRLQKFELPKGFAKTLMFFEGCSSHLGCSVVLRGGEPDLLTKVKRVLQFMIYASYHSRLEISFLMDEFAKPPSPQQQETDHKTTSVDAVDSFNDSLVSVEDRMGGGNSDTQVDIVSEQAEAEELQTREGVDSGKAGFRVRVSSMTKRIKAKVSGVKESSHAELDQNLDSQCEKAWDALEDTEAQEEFTEHAQFEASIGKDKLEPTAQSIPSEQPSSEVVSGLKPLKTDKNSKGTNGSPDVTKRASPQILGSTPDFDHEATTKEIESKCTEMRKNKLMILDTASIGSQEDVALSSPTLASRPKTVFSTALEEVILSISPHVNFNVPYFESKAGKESPLRCFFPSKDFYRSAKFSKFGHSTQGQEPNDGTTSIEAPEKSADVGQVYANEQQVYANEQQVYANEQQVYANVDRCSRTSDAVFIKAPHPFMFSQLTADAKDETMRSLLADFRARGGRIIDKPPTPIPKPMKPQSGTDQTQAPVAQMTRPLLDCLDIYNHQRMLLQFSSYSHLSSNAPNHCVNPWTVAMDYYSSRHDLTLGEFLERYCFSTKYKCLNEMCDAEMVDHVRRFVHGNASIHVLLRNLDSPIPGFTDKVLMWSWCRKCRQVTPVQPMSLDSWHMSFGKYLEMRFHCKDYGRRLSALPCGHSLHRHHYQYFGQHNIVASFKYSPILLREVSLPPLPLGIHQSFRSHTAPADELAMISTLGSQLLSDIHSKIAVLTTSSNITNMQSHVYLEQRNTQFMSQYQADSKKFWQNAKDVQSKITALSGLMSSTYQRTDEIANLHLELEDGIVNLKQNACVIAINWKNRLNEFVQQEKERNKKKSSPSVSRQNTPGLDREPTMSVLAAAAVKEVEQGTPNAATPPISPRFFPPTLKDETPAMLQVPTQPMTIPEIAEPEITMPATVKNVIERSCDSSDDRNIQSLTPEEGDVTTIPPSIAYLDTLGIKKVPNYGISPGIYAGLAYKSTTAEISEESNDHELVVIDAPEAENKESEVTVSQTPVAKEFEKDANECQKEGENKHANNLPAGVDRPDGPVSLTRRESQPQSPYRTKQNSGSKKTFFSTLLPGHDLAQVEIPYPPDEHHVLPSCSVAPIIIYDREPSSIIAYALSSEQYKTQLCELQQYNYYQSSEGGLQPNSNPGSKNSSPTTIRHLFSDNSHGPAEAKERSKKAQLTRKPSRGVISFFRSKNPDSPSASPSTQRKEDQGHFTYSDVIHYQVPGSEEASFSSTTESRDDSDFDISLRSGTEKRDPSSPHIELQFSDATNTQFFCLVYHADEFLQLRKTIFPAGEEVFIRSLSRSVTWLAQGGKSRSKFLKTKDDRFVLKQISRLEFQSFKEFAPYYIKYVQQAHAEQRPTTLAKILGVYKVGYQNPITNMAQKHVLLIMENLFYQRRMAQVFDLKGSIRNRHVKTTGLEQQDLVLMDENLLKHMVDSPLFVRGHSKAALSMAVHYDSMFLASHFIMDYSLLVGLDATSDELIVGIIDYIRTFTWDKKLEMMVKSTGIVGGQGKMPTVVSPELYRTRFCEAMDKYFLLVPDRWTNLGTEF